MINGILPILKPAGLTSHDVVQKVRQKLNIKKIGHTGTLDPSAEGVLILLIGRATKMAAKFSNTQKEYKVEIRFGYETDTWDSEGRITKIYRPRQKPSLNEIKKALMDFEGEIKQIVPPFSAKKIHGVRLYQLARKGPLEVSRLPRKKVMIFQAKILKYQYPRLVLKVNCGTGTYIRSLAFELGRKLKVGGTAFKIIRLRVGKWSIKDTVKLETFLTSKKPHKYIFPVDV